MDETVFRTYDKAAEYAKQRAAASGEPSEIKRSGELWKVVCTAGSPFDVMEDRYSLLYDVPEPRYLEPEMSEQQIIESRDNYREMIVSKGACYHCHGSGTGDRGHLCSICKGRGHLAGSGYLQKRRP